MGSSWNIEHRSYYRRGIEEFFRLDPRANKCQPTPKTILFLLVVYFWCCIFDGTRLCYIIVCYLICDGFVWSIGTVRWYI